MKKLNIICLVMNIILTIVLGIMIYEHIIIKEANAVALEESKIFSEKFQEVFQRLDEIENKVNNINIGE